MNLDENDDDFWNRDAPSTTFNFDGDSNWNKEDPLLNAASSSFSTRSGATLTSVRSMTGPSSSASSSSSNISLSVRPRNPQTISQENQMSFAASGKLNEDEIVSASTYLTVMKNYSQCGSCTKKLINEDAAVCYEKHRVFCNKYCLVVWFSMQKKDAKLLEQIQSFPLIERLVVEIAQSLNGSEMIRVLLALRARLTPSLFRVMLLRNQIAFQRYTSFLRQTNPEAEELRELLASGSESQKEDSKVLRHRSLFTSNLSGEQYLVALQSQFVAPAAPPSSSSAAPVALSDLILREIQILKWQLRASDKQRNVDLTKMSIPESVQEKLESAGNSSNFHPKSVVHDLNKEMLQSVLDKEILAWSLIRAHLDLSCYDHFDADNRLCVSSSSSSHDVIDAKQLWYFLAMQDKPAPLPQAVLAKWMTQLVRSSKDVLELALRTKNFKCAIHCLTGKHDSKTLLELANKMPASFQEEHRLLHDFLNANSQPHSASKR